MRVKIAAGPMEVEIEYDQLVAESPTQDEMIEKAKKLFREVTEEFAALGLQMMLDGEDPDGNLYG
jgi:hypothetical protein